MSDMTGTKASFIQSYAASSGNAFLRFDYSGHGQSSGRFADGTIGQWTADAIRVLDRLTSGPQILVGSSMGGWIMLLTALARPERIAGIVGIAAAPDFTEDLLWPALGATERLALEQDGFYAAPSEYSEEPYTITRRLLEEGRDHLLLRNEIPLTCPVRLIQGMQDSDVPWHTALRLTERLASEDVQVLLIKNGDHRLSTDDDLARLRHVLDDLIAGCSG